MSGSTRNFLWPWDGGPQLLHRIPNTSSAFPQRSNAANNVGKPLPKTRSCVNEVAPCSGDDASSLPRIAHFRQVRTVLKQRSQWSLTNLGAPKILCLRQRRNEEAFKKRGAKKNNGGVVRKILCFKQRRNEEAFERRCAKKRNGGGAAPPQPPREGGCAPRFILSRARMQVFPLQAFRIAVWIRNTGTASEQGGSLPPNSAGVGLLQVPPNSAGAGIPQAA